MKEEKTGLLTRLFDSTSKVVLWIVLVFCFYLVLRVIQGWEQGLSGAPEIIATIFGVVTIIVSGYTWKSKQENVLKLARKYKIDDKETLKQIIVSSDTTNTEE